SGSRVLVQQSIYDDFTTALAERAASLKVGDPFDPATEVGPLIHPEHLAKVSSYLELAREEGVRVAAGGEPHGELGGLYVRPTLFVGAEPAMRVAREEIF